MYRLVDVLGDGVVGLSSEYGRQLWCLARTRKSHACCVCDVAFPVGAMLYRPITNGSNRGQRMCENCTMALKGLDK